MTMAAYRPVPARTICTILSAKRFFGPCVTRLPFASTVPMSGFPRSCKKSLDHALFEPNSRSSMRRRSSLRRGLSGVALSSGVSEPHATNLQEVEWGGDIIRDVSWVEDRFVKYEWRCEGGMEGWLCRCLDCRSGGVGRCWWLGDSTSSESKQGTGRCRFLDVGNQ